MRILNLKHDYTLESINALAQKALLRSNGKERWEICDVHTDKKNVLMLLFGKLGMVDAVLPQQKHYRYAIVFGGTYNCSCSRFEYLVDAWRTGIRFRQLIFLGSHRPLSEPERQDWVKLNAHLPMPATEIEMLKAVYTHAAMPHDMQQVPVEFIIGLAKLWAPRATTLDTIIAWLATQPTSGAILAVSSQPFVGYQDRIFRATLPLGFTLETIGEKSPDTITTAVYLDNLARWIYQEKKLRNDHVQN